MSVLLSPDDLRSVALTLELAALSTAVLLALTLPLAWWLAHTRSPWRTPIAALAALPLVLPPTVLGFYLLLFWGPDGWGGQLTQWLGLGRLPFTFAGLVLGSVIYSLPFALQPLLHAFEQIGRRPLELAAMLRASPTDAFFSVALPLARPGILTAAVLSFAHTVGEFGMVLMLGGNIDGQTRVVSTQIYGHVEAQEYGQAHALAALMVAFSFAVLLYLQWSRAAKARGAP
jgi:molybdate transport system permease protein